MTRLFTAAAAVLLIACAATAAPAATLIDRIVAIVGNDVVTKSELDLEMAPRLEELKKRLRGDDLAQAADNLRNGTLNLLIDKKLQLQEAKLQGVTVEEEELDEAINDIKERNKMDDAQLARALANEGYTLAEYRDSLREQLLLIRLISSAVRSKVIIEEADITSYYNEHAADFAEHESVRVANIMFPAGKGSMADALEQAKAAKAKVESGEISFEEMAVKCTGDDKAAETCVLGTFGHGQLSEDVEKVAFGLGAGEVSEPIETAGGYQLIKVMERTENRVKPIDEVRGQIVEELNVSKGEEIFAKWIKELRDRSYVEIRE